MRKSEGLGRKTKFSRCWSDEDVEVGVDLAVNNLPRSVSSDCGSGEVAEDSVRRLKWRG